jgi:hypothetical protein
VIDGPQRVAGHDDHARVERQGELGKGAVGSDRDQQSTRTLEQDALS